MNEIHYSHESLIDLIDIERYITEDLASPKAAKNTVKKITRKVCLLKDHAELGARLSSIIDIETDYRFLVSGNYISFYRIDGNDIYVIRIIYGGRDYVSILFDSESDAPEVELDDNEPLTL